MGGRRGGVGSCGAGHQPILDSPTGPTSPPPHTHHTHPRTQTLYHGGIRVSATSGGKPGWAAMGFAVAPDEMERADAVVVKATRGGAEGGQRAEAGPREGAGEASASSPRCPAWPPARRGGAAQGSARGKPSRLPAHNTNPPAGAVVRGYHLPKGSANNNDLKASAAAVNKAAGTVNLGRTMAGKDSDGASAPREGRRGGARGRRRGAHGSPFRPPGAPRPLLGQRPLPPATPPTTPPPPTHTRRQPGGGVHLRD